MIEVRTQAEFDSVKAMSSIPHVVRIYPRNDGGLDYYELSTPWNIPNNVCIEGVNHPKIKYTGSYTSGTPIGLLSISGTSSVRRQNVTIKGIELSMNTASGAVCGITVDFVGKSLTTGLATGIGSRYDATTVGNVANANIMGVQIVNCRFRDFRSHCIFLNNSFNCKIINCDMNRGSLLRGINLINTSNCIISGNTVQNFNGQGIYLHNSHSNIIINNLITNLSNDGISLVAKSSKNTVIGNIIQNLQQGVYLVDSPFNTITNNQFLNNGDGLTSVTDSNHCTVANNLFQNNATDGVYAGSSSYNTYASNSFHNNGANALYVAAQTYATFVGNMIHDTQGEGIYVIGSTNNVFWYGNHTFLNGSANVFNGGTNSRAESSFNKLT